MKKSVCANGTGTTLNKIAVIEQEFDEPFADVVIGFAEMGYSKRLTAEVLSINRSYFLQLCRRFNLTDKFKPQREQIDECRGAGKSRSGWIKGKPRIPVYTYTDDRLLQELKRYPTKRRFATYSDIHTTTIIRRFGSWKKAQQHAGLRPVV